MPERRRPGRFTPIGLGLIIALVLALSVGVAAASTPVGVGASTIFAGNGFTANESLSVWESGPDGAITPLTGIQTDGNGGFTVTVTFPSAGQWQVTAHSIVSGKEVTGSYAVGGTTNTSTPPLTPPLSPATGTSPSTSQADVGGLVSFTGNGFTVNEQIALWETAPDSKTTALPRTQADGNGAFGVSVSFPSPGQWQVTAHGLTSAREVIGRYTIGSTSAVTSPPAASSDGSGFSTVPPVAVGAAVSFSGTGFNGSEPISLWETPPGGLAPITLDGTGADGAGTFATTVTFPSEGNWQVTAHGRDSAHEVIGRYVVTSDGSTTTTIPSTTTSSGATTSTAGATVKTTTGAVISFIPTGFAASELISVWSTAPDGTVATLDGTQASSTGRVIVTTSFATEGLWQLTAHGRDSGREVIGRYQVTTRTTP